MNEQRENTGILSRNEDKQKPEASPSWPDYKGSARIAGKDYWLSGWIKAGQRGKFLSLAIKPKDAQPDEPASTNDDDGMPF